MKNRMLKLLVVAMVATMAVSSCGSKDSKSSVLSASGSQIKPVPLNKAEKADLTKARKMFQRIDTSKAAIKTLPASKDGKPIKDKKVEAKELPNTKAEAQQQKK